MPQDTELHKAAKDGDLSGIQDLIGQGMDVNAQGAQGRTALHRSLGGGFVDCAAALLCAHDAVRTRPCAETHAFVLTSRGCFLSPQ